MPTLSDGLYGCYRCGYVWRARRSAHPRICARCKSRFWEVPVLRPVRTGTGPGVRELLGTHRAAIIRAAALHGFHDVRVFGSVRRSESSARSDVDLLVAREDSAGAFHQIALQQELESLLGRRVDLVVDESLHWLIRPQVLFEAVRL